MADSSNQETGKLDAHMADKKTLKQKARHIFEAAKDGAKKFGQKVLTFPREHPVATLLGIFGITALGAKVLGSDNMENLLREYKDNENGKEDNYSMNEEKKSNTEHKVWSDRLADINEGMYEENSAIFDAKVEKNYASAMLDEARKKGDPQLISNWEAKYEKWEKIFQEHCDNYELMKQHLAEHYEKEPK